MPRRQRDVTVKRMRGFSGHPSGDRNFRPMIEVTYYTGSLKRLYRLWDDGSTVWMEQRKVGNYWSTAEPVDAHYIPQSVRDHMRTALVTARLEGRI